MNAFELNNAAFDSACDNAEETVKYILDYAEGAFNLTVSREVAQKILDCRTACRAETEKNGEGQNSSYHFVEVPLSDIEL